jgi:two-component system OmpR family response regulator
MRIFIVDDEAFQREAVRDYLSSKFPQAEIFMYKTGEEALHEIYRKPDCVILDYYLNTENRDAANGIEILAKIKDVLPQVPVILLSGQEDPLVAVDTIKHGAFDYVVKNESSFTRLQILLDKIYGMHELKGKLGFQRVMNIILLLLVIAMIVGFIIQILM